LPSEVKAIEEFIQKKSKQFAVEKEGFWLMKSPCPFFKKTSVLFNR